MKPELTDYLGVLVRVEIDRPLGTVHPRHPDIYYTVNYGFVPDTRSGDGMPIDAYVLGIDEPVADAAGVVIAVVVRDDDIEDKLVVSTNSNALSLDEIKQAIN